MTVSIIINFMYLKKYNHLKRLDPASFLWWLYFFQGHETSSTESVSEGGSTHLFNYIYTHIVKEFPLPIFIKIWFALNPKIAGFYYFQMNIIQSKCILLGAIFYQTLQQWNCSQKYENIAAPKKYNPCTYFIFGYKV